MINLVFDTSVLVQETLTSARMQTLARLVKSGRLTLHLPQLVEREYATGVIAGTTSALVKASSDISRSMRAIRRSRVHSNLVALENALRAEATSLANSYLDDFGEWKHEMNVRTIDVQSSCLPHVLDMYFEGSGPFRQQKSREDLIDAIIGESIRLLAESMPVIAVVRDDRFREHLSSLENVDAFESLQDFLDQESVRIQLSILDREERADRYIEVLTSAEAIEAISLAARNNQPALDSIYFDDEGKVHGRERLEISSFGLRISAPDADDVISLDIDDPQFLGGNQFAYDFMMLAWSRIDFCASYGDYLELSYERERDVNMSSMNNVGICDLNEMRLIELEGRLLLTLDQGVDNEDLRAMIARADNALAGIEFEFEVLSGKLTDDIGG